MKNEKSIIEEVYLYYYMHKYGAERMNEQINQWTNESMNQWMNEQMNQSVNQSINEPINQSTSKPINQPIFFFSGI